jgi:hypothetical protein
VTRQNLNAECIISTDMRLSAILSPYCLMVLSSQFVEYRKQGYSV